MTRFWLAMHVSQNGGASEGKLGDDVMERGVPREGVSVVSVGGM